MTPYRTRMSDPTYFATLSKSYVDVPIDGGIDTATFLEATEGLIKLFDVLGNSAFGVVQSDMTGNVAKIRTRYLADPVGNSTLEKLVEGEKGEKKRIATEGLLWLTRGLKFTQISLTNSQANKSEELSVSFTKGYEASLKKYHNFVVKGIFAVAMKACPYRVDFYKKLGSDQPLVETQLNEWLAALEKIIAQIEAFYESGNYAKGL